jgi:hypothetical protein
MENCLAKKPVISIQHENSIAHKGGIQACHLPHLPGGHAYSPQRACELLVVLALAYLLPAYVKASKPY